MIEQQEAVQLYILLSDDVLESFHLWKDPEEIVSLAQPVRSVPAGPGIKPQIFRHRLSDKNACLKGLTPTSTSGNFQHRDPRRLEKRTLLRPSGPCQSPGLYQ